MFGADHVYRMDPARWSTQHIETGAGVTVAGIRVPRAEAKAFGCIDSDATGRITRVPGEAAPTRRSVPDDPEVTFASMGNYVFTTEALLDALRADAANADSDHDMGGDIIPMLVDAGQAHVYDFADNEVPGATDRDRGYWRDVGTIDAYYEAHMDLVSVQPVFNLYNQRVADPDRDAAAAAREVRRGRQRRGLHRRRRARSSPATIARLGDQPDVRGRRPGRWWRAACCCRACGSAAARWCAARSWTRTSWCPTAR